MSLARPSAGAWPTRGGSASAWRQQAASSSGRRSPAPARAALARPPLVPAAAACRATGRLQPGPAHSDKHHYFTPSTCCVCLSPKSGLTSALTFVDLLIAHNGADGTTHPQHTTQHPALQPTALLSSVAGGHMRRCHPLLCLLARTVASFGLVTVTASAEHSVTCPLLAGGVRTRLLSCLSAQAGRQGRTYTSCCKGYETKLQRQGERQGQGSEGGAARRGGAHVFAFQGRTAAQSGHLTLVGVHCWAA